MSGPKVIDFRGRGTGSDDLVPVVRHLRGGGAIAYPTETVYGFGGLCTDEGVAAVRAVKPRGEDRPFLALVAGVEEVSGLRWTPEARELASIFWPGALTLVLGDPEGIFPPGIRSREGDVAVRVSPHPFVRALIETLGEPITSTSANLPGEPPARSGAEVVAAAVGRGAGPELLVVEAGELAPSAPSTIVDCAGTRPRVMREGSIPLNRLRCVLPELNGR